MKTTLCYFSATGTTRKTLRAIARGIAGQVCEIDYTLPQKRMDKAPDFSEDDFVIFGVPVYGGLMPIFCRNYIENLHGSATPCAIVCVYGNRAFDDCLTEMYDLVKQRGFVVMAAGAFIGEHSFSNKIATERPDEVDILAAETFGKEISRKISSGITELSFGDIPGNFPVKERTAASPHPGPATSGLCIGCGLCADECPMGAIDFENKSKVNSEKCIRCLHCVRVCTTGAKKFIDDGFKNAAENCVKAFAQPRKEPKTII